MMKAYTNTTIVLSLMMIAYTNTTIVLSLIVNQTATFNSDCPKAPERYFRSKALCDDTRNYTCLFDENLNSFEESCTIKQDFQRPGYRVTLRTNVHADACPDDLYQPVIFLTNTSSNCEFKRSFCNEEGQIVSSNGTIKTDKQCRCNYAYGYTYVIKPKDICSCTPSTEDCSCFRKTCPMKMILSPDYKCIKKSRKPQTHLCLPIHDFGVPTVYDTSNILHTKNDKKGTVRQKVSSDRTIIILLIGMSLFLLTVFVIIVIALRPDNDTLSDTNGNPNPITGTQETAENPEHSPCFEKNKSDEQNGCQMKETIDAINKVAKQKIDAKEKEKKEKDKACSKISSYMKKPYTQFKDRIRWKKAIKSLQETSAITDIKKNLASTNCILLWGKPDCGKTYSINCIALYLETEFAYTLIPCREISDIFQQHSTTKKCIFVIDDICDRFIFSSEKISLLKIHQKSIETVLQDNNAKLLMTCSTPLKSDIEYSFSSLKIYTCEITAPKLSTVFEETAKLFTTDPTLPTVIKQTSSDTLLLSLVKLGDCIPVEETVSYLKYPSAYLQKKTEELLLSNTSAFCSLLFCILKKGCIDADCLTSDEYQQMFWKITEMVFEKLNIFDTPQKLSLSENELNFFIENDHGLFSIKQTTVYNELAIYFGKKLQNIFVKYADLEIIIQHCVLETCKTIAEKERLFIAVNKDNEQLYFERIKYQLISKHTGEAICIPQIGCPRYKEKLKQFWKQVEKDERDKFHKKYKESVTTFEAAGKAGYVNLQQLCYELLST